MGERPRRPWPAPLLAVCPAMLVIALLSGVQTTHAQTPSAVNGSPKDAAPTEAAQEVQEVVVTAQRREERLMDVPVAVSAVSGETLVKAGVQAPVDIAQLLPGITFNDSGPNDTFAIRGVSLNDLGDSNESPIAYYRDDVYIAAIGSVQSQMFDISRVEVLRGPQGTLFGRNATGGVVQLVSNKPTATWTGDLSAQYGSYDQVVINGALGGPISDRIRERTAFTFDRDDGWQRNVITDQRTAKAKDWGVREIIDIDLISSLKAELNFHIGDQNDLVALYGSRGTINNTTIASGQDLPCTQSQVIALAPQCTTYLNFRDPHPTPTTVYSTVVSPKSQLSNRGGSLTLTGSVSEVDITSISAYEYTRKFFSETGVPGPNDEYDDLYGATRAQYSQEIRASDTLGPVHLTGGLYYFNEHLTNGFYIIPSLLYLGTYGTENHFSETTHAEAVFTQADYKPTSDVTLTAGIRYSREKKTLNITDDLENPTYHETDESQPDAVTWKLGEEWRFTPGWMTYASISTGFKSSGFNTTGVTAGGSVASKPEHIITYEVGVKGNFWENRVNVVPDVFYSRYTDFQLVDLATVAGSNFEVNRLINIPLATIEGVELDVNANPLRGLSLDINGTYTHSKIRAPGYYLGDLLLDNQEITNTPKVTLKASAEYRWDNEVIGRIAPRVSADYQSGFAPNLTCWEFVSCIVPGYTIVNAGIQWTPPGKPYQVDVFVNNALNKVYETGSYYFGDVNALIWGRPRMAGVRLSAHW